MKHTIKNSTVYLMDCMEGMKQYPNNYFDLAVVDPPYGININMNMGRRKGKKKKHQDKKWDDSTPSDSYFIELKRISINQIIWGGNYFKLGPCKHFIFWDKQVPSGLSFSDGEMAWTSYDRSIKKVTSRNITGDKIHPTQKPTALYDWIYKNYLPDGGKVIDTHLGSGSNRIAAEKANNIDFVGYEIDEDYFKESCKRFENHVAQQRLF